MRTEMDVLIMEDFILLKEEQARSAEEGDWVYEQELD
jgi:hypothetical protein